MQQIIRRKPAEGKKSSKGWGAKQRKKEKQRRVGSIATEGRKNSEGWEQSSGRGQSSEGWGEKQRQ